MAQIISPFITFPVITGPNLWPMLSLPLGKFLSLLATDQRESI